MPTTTTLEPSGPIVRSRRPAPPTTRVALSARFLGSFEVTLAHRPVPLGTSRRTRVLLAYVLDRSPLPIPRDVLMDVFWPDASPSAARNSLHVAMCAVRKALACAWDGPVIDCRGDVYQLSDELELWTDVDELARRCDLGAAAAGAGRLEEAVAEYEAARTVYGGDFLADDPYLDWAFDRREEARLRVLTSVERLGELQLELGDVRQAVSLSAAVLREEPCHEAVARRLMVAYARLGQPHMALRQYERIVEVLRRELGVEAAAETDALAARIRTRAPV